MAVREAASRSVAPVGVFRCVGAKLRRDGPMTTASGGRLYVPGACDAGVVWAGGFTFSSECENASRAGWSARRGSPPPSGGEGEATVGPRARRTTRLFLLCFGIQAPSLGRERPLVARRAASFVGDRCYLLTYQPVSRASWLSCELGKPGSDRRRGSFFSLRFLGTRIVGGHR